MLKSKVLLCLRQCSFDNELFEARCAVSTLDRRLQLDFETREEIRAS